MAPPLPTINRPARAVVFMSVQSCHKALSTIHSSSETVTTLEAEDFFLRTTAVSHCRTPYSPATHPIIATTRMDPTARHSIAPEAVTARAPQSTLGAH